MQRFGVVVCALAIACSSHPAHHEAAAPPPAHGSHTLTIIGTNDLHGALDRLPMLAGFVANVRAARAADGGGVLLVDAGDLFQGTLESNLGEGIDVVRAYNQMGYAASAIGNHEFDYGPEGPAVTVHSTTEDPRGALKARVAQATFPFLITNIFDARTGERVAWPNAPASRIVDIAGLRVGIVGASTEVTPFTTMPANFLGLEMTSAALAITAEAKAVREQGAQVVVVVAHLGSECKDLDHPDDVSSCDHKDELFRVLDQLPKGLVDALVAGHTHAAVAHRIDGIPVIESYSSGRAFGRIDLTITDGHVTASVIHKPELMCPLDAEHNAIPVAECHPGPYEGKPVVSDPVIQKIADDALARAGERRGEKLGVTLAGTITKRYKDESALGDWFADLMLASVPGHADIALTNGGGLRADIPGGELTYGQLFAAMPFDNRFAIVEVRGSQVRRLVTSNLQRSGGIFSWGGLSLKARCKASKLEVSIAVGGKPLADDATYKLVTSDFLASGGDGVIGRLKLPENAITATDTIIRDAMADVLRKQKGTIDPAKIFGPGHARMDFEGKRPIHCGSGGGRGADEEPE